MNQNSTVDNDLQKAIDDITNNANTDPVFSDPVAAPSSVPEDDDGTLAEPVGPFPEPQPVVPTPTAPLENAPDLGTPVVPTPEIPNYDYYTAPVSPEPITPEPIAEPATIPEPIASEPIAPVIETAPVQSNLGMHQVKEAALRDLIPIMDKVSLSPSQKFHIYRDMFENLRDYTVLEPAYHAAAEIPDERERAEALLYLVESIDKM
ncbi:hypothetical protein IKF94_00145 [Candidatus Saccharibacteria bacterium]|nr:hypothetical protein [Candidatus Saccharibacteria bacterium]